MWISGDLSHCIPTMPSVCDNCYQMVWYSHLYMYNFTYLVFLIQGEPRLVCIGDPHNFSGSDHFTAILRSPGHSEGGTLYVSRHLLECIANIALISQLNGSKQFDSFLTPIPIEQRGTSCLVRPTQAAASCHCVRLGVPD